MSFSCRNPQMLTINGELVQVPCKKCPPCLDMHKIEWYNRMVLEQFGKTYLPFFTTFTYAPEFYQDDMREAIRQAQLFFKRLRKAGHDIRYFMAVERGKKTNRLHNHVIIWSKSLSRMRSYDSWKILYDGWNKGRVDCSVVRTLGALKYTAKYITKDNYADSSTLDDISNLKNGYAKKDGRPYTWSNRPALGEPGIERWKLLISKQKKFYSWVNKPPNNFRFHFQGKLVKAYIPRDTYQRILRELDIDIKPPKLKFNILLQTFGYETEEVLTC